MTKTTTKKKIRRKKASKKATKKKLPGEIVGEMNGFPVRRVQVGALTGATYNPRRITDTALKHLQASTNRFGLVQPVVWNKRTCKIVGGHQRLKTLAPNDHTDVVEVDLSLDEEKALNLALNNGHAAGEFTGDLAVLLGELELALPDLSQDLGLEHLYTDLPAEVDDLLDGVEDSKGPDEGKASPRDSSKEDDASPDSYEEHKQIVVVLTDDEHTEAIRGLESVMRNESCESYTEALLWLLKKYTAKRGSKKTTRK